MTEKNTGWFRVHGRNGVEPDSIVQGREAAAAYIRDRAAADPAFRRDVTFNRVRVGGPFETKAAAAKASKTAGDDGKKAPAAATK